MRGNVDTIFGMPANRPNDIRRAGDPPDLDRTDIAILGLLQNNARQAVKEIAAAVGLAPSSTHERIQRLRAAGMLRGAHADVDARALGVGLEALFMIGLSKHKRGTVDRFLDDVVAIPEVRFAFLVTGRHDLVVHVVVRDMQHLKDLALDHFTNRPAVTRIETSIIFDARRRWQLPVLLAKE
jgi:DNA-binding Lrp family transcriptional regulator